MTFVLGAADARYGVTGMMSLEAAAGAMSAALYGLAAWRWSRPPAMAFATG